MLNIFHGLPYVPTTFDEAETWIPTQHTKFHKDKTRALQAAKKKKRKEEIFESWRFFLTRNDKNSCKG